MNVILLQKAAHLAACVSHGLKMLTTIEIDGHSITREDRTNAKEGLSLFNAGKMQCDIATLVVLVAAGEQDLLNPQCTQRRASELLGITFDQMERLNNYPLWPERYRRIYRAALKMGDYEYEIFALQRRVTFFIATHGIDRIIGVYDKTKTSRTPEGG